MILRCYQKRMIVTAGRKRLYKNIKQPTLAGGIRCRIRIIRDRGLVGWINILCIAVALSLVGTDFFKHLSLKHILDCLLSIFLFAINQALRTGLTVFRKIFTRRAGGISG